MKSHFSLILLSTLQCNADCEYCFENKTTDRLTLDRLKDMICKMLNYMIEKSLTSLTLYWQGGGVMLLPPSWYVQGHELIQREAEARGKQVFHSLQSNMLAYSSRWNKVIAEMFGNSVGTSLDHPNLHRKLLGQGPESYNAIWTKRVQEARAAGIDVQVIAVPNQATLDIGAERFYTHFVDELGVTDFQVAQGRPRARAWSDVMRSDMFELLLERPRGYRGRHGRKAPSYPRAKMSAGALDGSALVEPYGTRYRTKWLAENLAPLRRWLGQQVGRPWDRVYSELSEHLSPNNAVKQHVRDHVDDFVELHVIEHDGRLFTAQGTALGLYRRRRSVLYVCPRTGLLRELRGSRGPRAIIAPSPTGDGWCAAVRPSSTWRRRLSPVSEPEGTHVRPHEGAACHP